MLLNLALPSSSVRSPGPLTDHFRFPEGALPDFRTSPSLKDPNGFFRFGDNLVCYGQTVGEARPAVNGHLFDASQHVQRKDGTIVLPFDVNQVFDNLRYERYSPPSKRGWLDSSWTKDAYYWLRPLLPIGVRRNLQKLYLRDWDALQFPGWPVDRSVDLLFERLLVLAMQALQIDRLPFIWFWPEGHSACAIMTHDVEARAGRDFCDRLMDIDDAFGIKASFQIVPEKRYSVSRDFLEGIRRRGCEVNVQGLDHEGNLFQDRATFMEAARKINQYAQQFGSRGFRSPVLYRHADWFQELSFSYDMSVPNVARLEAQRGGCCTVMPYVLPGGMTELPLTTTEDYTLFHILKDYSTSLWNKQMAGILEGHGLMSFIIHPDYLMEDRAQNVYKDLLEEISRLRSDQGVWVTLPGEVDRWWRARNEMTLVPEGRGWKIEGAGSDRASVVTANLAGDRLVYEFDSEGSKQ